ncbi:AAA family ATPase [Janibacter sp. GXQ6167]|uniref:AAA family ATPase n=1 Tax=Janibacter sp. GXQ6167 TaxID=3240791 RepID=UPI003525991A
MKLHHLAITAFGPFAEPVQIDLDALGQSGLFLVHGPTGAGKTSLLDAVCFALFAEVPGDRTKDSLRSHHAAEGAHPQVVLELTAAGRHLRITRSPAYARAKKSGTGTTTQQARVVLEERVDHAWTTLSTRLDETAETIHDILGMGLAQFRRVMLLPQGEFAAFLRSDATARRSLLEKLFDISDYAAVERWLADEARRTSASVRASRERLEQHLAHLSDILAGSEVDLPEVDLPEVDLVGGEQPWLAAEPSLLPAAVDDIAAVLLDRATECMSRADEAKRADRSAAARREEALALATARRRAEAAQATLNDLAASKAQHESRRREADRARDADAVIDVVRLAERSRTQVQAVHAARDLARAALPEVIETGADLAAWADEADEASEDLRRAHHELANLTRAQATVAAASERVDRAQAAVAAIADQREDASAAVATAEASLHRARHAERRLAEIGPRLALLTDLVETYEQRADLRSSLDEAADAVRVAHDEELATREDHLGLVQARLDNMAGELAGSLLDGAPCVVCGALEHPAPAQAAQAVTSAEIASAQARVDAAAATHAQRRARRDGLQGRIDQLTARLDDLVTTAMPSAEQDGPIDEEAIGELREETARLITDQATLRPVAKDRPEAEQRVERARVRLGELTEASEDARVEVARARTSKEGLTDEVDAAATRLTNALRAHAKRCGCLGTERDGDDEIPAETLVATLDATTAAHEQAVAAVRALLDADHKVDEARLAAADAETVRDRALGERGFADALEATSAYRSGEQQEELRDQCAAYERAHATATATLAEPEIRAALAAEPPDLDALEAAAAEARAHRDGAARRHAQAEAVLAQFSKARERVLTECALIGPATERADVVRRVADLVNGSGGDNDRRMPLTTYVLAARLERIVELANERLESMADGRYELVHDDSRASHGRKGGLGLLVQDRWTGQHRPTGTLSGGESFAVSLALALGLADAVREESGGIEFGTLFVDEGFGSLDQDSLDQVLDLLDRLRDGGRAVGVVSHVAEMRGRIPTQVRVTKTPRGSSVEVVAS